ncbi:DNA repair protein RecN [Varunaivibrio sulfuroxidans]|uniref:DNA repair protein RecN n=1 Tax=Varunaivibrio sulfuroxidans TaxID=1773489 RepID=A0A4R3JAZ3_9PROT|nr:DNA repair protein RecN [Varunaivibrio sulfuroxidans]TCS62203.1 DNA replication and repair protein RecN [Varunaivibrio sulfuroxidans]WES30629.1 DNA repair protein RecN [Varunaivibrio sulfuroxidans]
MLRTLSIRDVVLIDRLDLTFGIGLGVFTGETGAGKSILLDSLGLALGARAEARLVRGGAAQAVVSAEFDLPQEHSVLDMLAEHGIAVGRDEPLVLRRVLAGDGRSRGYINDQAVSVSLLRRIGDELVEIHGQFDNQRLLNTSVHRVLLDAYGGHGDLLAAVGAAHRDWRAAVDARKRAVDALEEARRDEEFLRHALGELDDIAPEPGEESELSRQRQGMMNGEKLLEAMNQAAKDLGQGRGVERMLRDAVRALEPMVEKTEGALKAVLEPLELAQENISEALLQLERASQRVDLDPNHLEQLEERLFALRALARKHNVTVDDLAVLRETIAARLAEVDDGDAGVRKLTHAQAAARKAYEDAAAALSAARVAAADTLSHAVMAELAPLRLGAARFSVIVAGGGDADAWGEGGWDRIAFEVATNPGAPPGPLGKIASGGELSRFMLALKVVLSKADPVPTLIFDEVDSGIGGAAAAAVGQRLARMADEVQVLVVTHSPQVAARGENHWRVSKSAAPEGVRTRVEELSRADRQEEIARMLAGERVTDEARAAADSLLQGTES